MIKTFKYRIKDKNKIKILNQMDRDVKFAWNVLNSASRKKWKESRKYFHKYDSYFTNIFKGASKELSINSQTLQSVSDQFHKDIHQQKKQLKYKGRKTRGWVPFKGQTIRCLDDRFIYDKKHFKFWKSRPFPKDSIIKVGSFNCDNLGRWYINFSVDYANEQLICGQGDLGIDLGLKTTATTSNDEELKLKPLEKIDKKIAKQQRARNFKRAKHLHIKKANKRKDDINKFALGLVKRNNRIAVGNVSGFTKGKLAKSRYNNSWSIFKNVLKFKCEEYQAEYKEVSEYLTTQTCNDCGHVGGPKGVKELGVREWVCINCNRTQQRDNCAAKNIRDRAWCQASYKRNPSDLSVRRVQAEGYNSLIKAKDNNINKAIFVPFGTPIGANVNMSTAAK